MATAGCIRGWSAFLALVGLAVSSGWRQPTFAAEPPLLEEVDHVTARRPRLELRPLEREEIAKDDGSANRARSFSANAEFRPLTRHSIKIIGRKAKPTRASQRRVHQGAANRASTTNRTSTRWITDSRVLPAQAQDDNFGNLFPDPPTTPESDSTPDQPSEPFQTFPPPNGDDASAVNQVPFTDNTVESPSPPPFGDRGGSDPVTPQNGGPRLPDQVPYSGQSPQRERLPENDSYLESPFDSQNCDEKKALCADLLRELKRSGLRDIDLNIRLAGAEGVDFPCVCDENDEIYEDRQFAAMTYNWTASSICHKPLYFEEPGLERHGHTVPLLHPVISAAHFFGTIPALPYCMGMDPPWECKYTLGHYRPGSCAPYFVPPVPLSPRGALMQGAVSTGAAFIVP